MTEQLWAKDATDLAAMIRRRDVSAREVVRAHLDRMHAVNPAVNAIVRDLSDQALNEAERADAALARGEIAGPLHGVPITTKINTDQTGVPTDNGVIVAKDLIAKDDSPAIGSLRRAGAIVIGRTNAPAFSLRVVTNNALHGLTINPWNRAVTCGGSSGGAGASLAIGIGAIAQGNDIGGSIRWPAYCNGIVGLRPSTGRVAAFNETAARTAARGFATQMMAVNGPLARSVRDAELALSVMSAADARDPIWAPAPLTGPPRPLRAALVIEDGVTAAAKDAVRRSGRHLSDAGYEVDEITPPRLDRLTALWFDIGLCELGATLLPSMSKIGDADMEKAMSDLWALFGHRDLDRYQAALRERDTIVRQWQAFLTDYAVVVLPACAVQAFAFDCDTQGREALAKMIFEFRYQIGLPVLGLPVLAVPMGVQDGLPMGVQILSGKYREDLCLAAGRIIECNEPAITPINPRP